jgi:hypothetical protein
MCSLDVRFTVMRFRGHSWVFYTENDIENIFDSEMQTKTAHPKRKCNRPINKLKEAKQ